MRDLNESAKALRELLSQRILVLDGAMGTMLQQRELSAADFGGAALEGCNENLVRTRPDVVLDIHRKYFEAGSDIVETNSFGGAPIVLAEYGLAADAHLLNNRCPAKAIGLDDVRSRFKIFSVDIQHHVRPRSNQVFIAAFERSSAKVRRTQLPLLQHRPHRAVQHKDSL